MKKYDVGIIGNGFVGESQAFAFSPTCNILIYDKNPLKSVNSIEEVLKSDFVFVCVPFLFLFFFYLFCFSLFIYLSLFSLSPIFVFSIIVFYLSLFSLSFSFSFFPSSVWLCGG